jgi:dihydrofolate synthase/folylpolyglutamate synthase
VETGLGGRLDATNVVTPLVSVITTISIDHTIQLGNTVQSIAGEKAGIIKPGIPIVSGPQQPEAQAVIKARAEERQAPLLSFGRDIEVSGVRPIEPAGLSFDVRTPAGWRRGLKLRLLGPHQATNAAVAVAAAEVAAERGGFALPTDAVARGLAGTRAPGRVEFFPGEPAVILDAAHNPASTRALAEALCFHFAARPVVLLFGIAGDKDVPGTLQEVLPLARALVATTNLSPRSAKPEEIARLAREGGCREVHAEPDVPKAFALARNLCQRGELLVITGSFYLAGAIRELMAKEH